MYVAICTPSLGQMRSRYTASLMRMVVYYMMTPVPGYGDETRYLSYHIIEGSMVGQARDTFVDDTLANPNVTHLLFIDEDMGFREDSLNIMLSRKMPFVAANYRMKVVPCDFTAMSTNNKTRVQTTEEKTGLEQAAYAGFGLALIERKVLENVHSPRFENKWDTTLKAYSTEDKSFCELAKQAGYPPMIDHDISKRVYHTGTWHYSWDNAVFAEWPKEPYAERAGRE